jgi:hypothetical protein
MTEEEMIKTSLAHPTYSAYKYSGICSNSDCGEIFYTQRLTGVVCSLACRRGIFNSQWLGKDRFGNGRGYILINGQYNHPREVNGRVLEHILVMEKHLGRYLKSGENIHHKNGLRDDNRIENLELWTTYQPSGQRVEDLLNFVIEHYPSELKSRLDKSKRDPDASEPLRQSERILGRDPLESSSPRGR